MTDTPEDDKGFQFPCSYLIKAMGFSDCGLDTIVIDIVSKHCEHEHIDHLNMHSKPSRTGKYVSVNLPITAHSREQLDAIYDDLTKHEKILMRL